MSTTMTVVGAIELLRILALVVSTHAPRSWIVPQHLSHLAESYSLKFKSNLSRASNLSQMPLFVLSGNFSSLYSSTFHIIIKTIVCIFTHLPSRL